MKFNLKNRPSKFPRDYIKEGEAVDTGELIDRYIKATIEWFEGFEKELIGRLKEHFERAYEKPCGCKQCKIIEEILGEEALNDCEGFWG